MFITRYKKAALPLALALSVSAPLMYSMSASAAEESPVVNQTGSLALNIPAGSLTSALNQLARQAGVTLSFDASKVANQTTSGLKGSYTLDQGFKLLLTNSGFEVNKTAAGYVLIETPTEDDEEVFTFTGENVVQLDKVVVTASGYEQEAAEAPASISVISREDLDKRYYSDVTDALRDQPGVTVTGGGGGDRGEDISMRGMPASYTLMLVDGKPQSSRESRPNGNAGFEQDWLPPMEAVERIEVVRGPMSTLYGSDAMGGVINVITRKVPKTWSGNLSLDTILQDNSKSGDIQEANFYLGGPIATDTLGIQLYGRTYHRDEDEILNGYDEKDLDSVTARLAFTPNQNHDIIIEAGRSEQTRKAHMGMSAATTGCRGGCSDSESEHQRDYYSISHTGRWDIGTTDTYFQRETTKNEGRDIEIENTIAKSSLVTGFDTNILTLGLYYENQELNDQNSNQVSDRTQIENTQWAAFAEDEWMISQPFSLTLGARFDNAENYGTHISPRVYGVWRLNSEWILKGGVSTGFRSPSLRETIVDWGQVSRGGNVYGNPDLEPETSVTQEISLHYNTEHGVSTGLTIFNNDFKDKITRIDCPINICNAGANQFGSDPTYRINVDEANTQGVEWALSLPLTQTLSSSASYTYTDSEQKSGEDKGEPLVELPKHQASLSMDWTPIERLNSWMRVTYRGEENQTSSDETVPSYTFLDTGLTYKFTKNVSAKFAVYNLLNEQVTYDEYGYVDDGRRYWFSLNVGF